MVASTLHIAALIRFMQNWLITVLAPVDDKMYARFPSTWHKLKIEHVLICWMTLWVCGKCHQLGVHITVGKLPAHCM